MDFVFSWLKFSSYLAWNTFSRLRWRTWRNFFKTLQDSIRTLCVNFVKVLAKIGSVARNDSAVRMRYKKFQLKLKQKIRNKYPNTPSLSRIVFKLISWSEIVCVCQLFEVLITESLLTWSWEVTVEILIKDMHKVWGILIRSP